MYDVVGIDMPCIDLNVNMPHYPESGHGGEIRQLSWQGGGKVASGMVACARLGAKCAMMGSVGDDIYGRFIIGDFERHNVDVSAMKIYSSDTTSLSIVLSDYETGSRTIIYNRGSAPQYTLDDMDLDMIKEAKYFFICHANEHIVQAAEITRKTGVQVFVDADGYSESMVALIPKIDVFVGSEYFYDTMFGNEDYEENCRKIITMGPRIAVFTLGDKGCAGMSAEGYFRIPAFDVRVEDTVGAGDAFHGAFIAGLLEGLTVEETARLASAVAAIKCTRIGGRAGLPDRKTVERFLRDGVIDYTEIDAYVELYRRGLERV